MDGQWCIKGKMKDREKGPYKCEYSNEVCFNQIDVKIMPLWEKQLKYTCFGSVRTVVDCEAHGIFVSRPFAGVG